MILVCACVFADRPDGVIDGKEQSGKWQAARAEMFKKKSKRNSSEGTVTPLATKSARLDRTVPCMDNLDVSGNTSSLNGQDAAVTG